jgi:hypothetical protein
MGVVSVFESRTTRRLGENAPAVAGPLGGVFVFAGLAMIASGLALGAWTVNGGQPNPELIAAAVVVPPMLATVVGAMLRVRSLF